MPQQTHLQLLGGLQRLVGPRRPLLVRRCQLRLQLLSARLQRRVLKHSAAQHSTAQHGSVAQMLSRVSACGSAVLL